MKNYLIIPGLLGLLCGCTTITRTPAVRVAPPSAGEAKWSVSAKDDSGDEPGKARSAEAKSLR